MKAPSSNDTSFGDQELYDEYSPVFYRLYNIIIPVLLTILFTQFTQAIDYSTVALFDSSLCWLIIWFITPSYCITHL